jgi:hypothetical protein
MLGSNLAKADLCFELQKTVVSSAGHKDKSKFEFDIPGFFHKMSLNAKDC